VRGVDPRDLARISELRDLSIALKSPDAYFQADDTKFSAPLSRAAFLAIERDLQGLDAAAWVALRAEAIRQLTARQGSRGWQRLFSILNQARAYNYLIELGCADVAFVPVSTRKTPDLAAWLGPTRVLCEVKTIHISDDEVERRTAGGVWKSVAHVEPGFLEKLRSDIDKASAQMVAFHPGPGARRIAYIVVNFDDLFHEYAPECRAHIEVDLAANPPSDVEVVLDIKPPFEAARSSQ
jgi:hypothetical protein